jgi:hypothetical protein
MYGAGVYAYYPDRVPLQYQGDPLVIFQALPVRACLDTREVFLKGRADIDIHFFAIRGTIGAAIPVALLGFVNCPRFSSYHGRLYYV